MARAGRCAAPSSTRSASALANVRLVARLDVKATNLIKGIHLEGLRVVGDPQAHAQAYYEAGIDELLYMDIVASLYGRNSLLDLVRRTAEDIFVPLTVGGGIRTVEDVHGALLAGADKVAINTAAVRRPELLEEVARRFGSQCVVLGIEAKLRPEGGWEAYTDNGRERTGRDAVEWAREAVQRGIGEILLTSVDREGTRRGFDVELVRTVADAVPVPVIASGGMGTTEHLVAVARDGRADAVAMADVLHYGRLDLAAIRAAARDGAVAVRCP